VNVVNFPHPSSRTRPWGYLASKRNEYQKLKSNVCREKSASGA
jgi:hypothetical protein